MPSLYPGALDTNDSLYVAANGLRGFLSADITSASTILNFQSALPSNVPPTGYVTINGEAIHYSAKTATSLTGCTRGQDGTSAAAHFKNDEVDFGPVADHHNSLVQAIQAIEAKLGSGNAGQISGAQLVAASVTGAKVAANTLDGTKFALADLLLPAGFRLVPVVIAAGPPVVSLPNAAIQNGVAGVTFGAGSNDEVGTFSFTLTGAVAAGANLFTLTYRRAWPNGSVFWAGNNQGWAPAYLTGVSAGAASCIVYSGIALGAATYTFGYITRGW